MKTKTKADKIKQIKEQIAAYRKGEREAEIEAHNGKPFTAPHCSENKKDKLKKRDKVIKAALKRKDFEFE